MQKWGKMYEFPWGLPVRMFVEFRRPKLFPWVDRMPWESLSGGDRLSTIFGRYFRSSFPSLHLRPRTDRRRLQRRNDREFPRGFAFGFCHESGAAGISAFAQIPDDNWRRNFGDWRRYFKHKSFSTFPGHWSPEIELARRHRIEFRFNFKFHRRQLAFPWNNFQSVSTEFQSRSSAGQNRARGPNVDADFFDEIRRTSGKSKIGSEFRRLHAGHWSKRSGFGPSKNASKFGEFGLGLRPNSAMRK